MNEAMDYLGNVIKEMALSVAIQKDRAQKAEAEASKAASYRAMIVEMIRDHNLSAVSVNGEIITSETVEGT